MGEYRDQGFGTFQGTRLSPEEADLEKHRPVQSIEDKITPEALRYANEVINAEKEDMRHQYMVRQADAVRKLLARVGSFENLTEEACQSIVDDELFYDKTIVFTIAKVLHKNTSLKH